MPEEDAPDRRVAVPEEQGDQAGPPPTSEDPDERAGRPFTPEDPIPGAPVGWQTEQDRGAADGPDPAAPRRDRAAPFWHVALAVDLTVIGLMLLSNLIIGFQLLVRPDSEAARQTREALEGTGAGALVLNSLLLVLVFGAVPLAWVVGTRQGGWRGAVAYLRLQRPGTGLAIGAGAGLLVWLVLLLAVAALLAVLQALGVDVSSLRQESPIHDDLARNLTWPLAFLLAGSAAFGEEVLFRGVLQKWLGVWGQAVVFGIMHAGYGTVLQLVLPFLIGLAFGYAMKKGGSLWIVMGAHFTFNLVQFALMMLVDPA